MSLRNLLKRATCITLTATFIYALGCAFVAFVLLRGYFGLFKFDGKGRADITYKELVQSDRIIHKSMKSRLSNKILTMSLPACHEDLFDFSSHQGEGLTEKDLYDSNIKWVFPYFAFSPIGEKSIGCLSEMYGIKDGRSRSTPVSYVRIENFLPMSMHKDMDNYYRNEEDAKYWKHEFVTEKNGIRMYYNRYGQTEDRHIQLFFEGLKHRNKTPVGIELDNIGLPSAKIETYIHDEFQLKYRVFPSNTGRSGNTAKDNFVKNIFDVLYSLNSDEELLNRPELLWELVDNNEKVVQFFESHSIVTEGE